jgi:hypothetical protein
VSRLCLGVLLSFAFLTSCRPISDFCQQNPEVCNPQPPSPTPTQTPAPSPTPTPTPTPLPSPIATPSPLPSPVPSPTPTPNPCPSATPQPAPSVPGCEPCAHALAGLETVGYAPARSDPRFLEMDNCLPGASGDTKGCTYVSRQPVTVNGQQYPACTFFNREMRAKRGGVPPENGICASTAKPSPRPVDSPAPCTPPPVTGESDVARINVFHYDNADQGCKEKGNPFVIPTDPPCKNREIHATLTPKSDPPCAVSNCDAQKHGNNVRWWAGGQEVLDEAGVDVGCAVVGRHESNPTFNVYMRATGGRCPNGFTLRVQLIAPDGRVFTAEKTVLPR